MRTGCTCIASKRKLSCRRCLFFFRRCNEILNQLLSQIARAARPPRRPTDPLTGLHSHYDRSAHLHYTCTHVYHVHSHSHTQTYAYYMRGSPPCRTRRPVVRNFFPFIVLSLFFANFSRRCTPPPLPAYFAYKHRVYRLGTIQGGMCHGTGEGGGGCFFFLLKNPISPFVKK